MELSATIDYGNRIKVDITEHNVQQMTLQPETNPVNILTIGPDELNDIIRIALMFNWELPF